MDLNSDVSRISSIIEDYGFGAYGKLDSAHVHRWLEQFDDNHNVLAHETANILEKHYIKEEDFTLFSKSLIGYLKSEFGENFTIIKSQEESKSQVFLINMIRKNKGSDIYFENKNNIKNNIVYIDDFIFSGQTLIRDFNNWLEANNGIRNVTINVITIAKYDYSTKTTLTFLEKRYKSRNIKFISKSFAKYKITDSFQLRESSLSDDTISRYLDMNPSNLSSSRIRAGNLITNVRHRDLYEVEMVKAGIKIIELCENPSMIMRPLGFGGYGLGFGGALFSYRKCPNTTPLAFWWGNPNYSSANHPFRKWYPLMQRNSEL